MTPEQLTLTRALLDDGRVLSLALIVDGMPVVGLLPFAATAGYRALVVHASRLARHTKGLQHGAAFEALVHEAVDDDVDPLQVKRLTVRGEVVVVDPALPIHDTVRSAYLQKFPEAAPITQLGDFAFYLLRVTGGRLVTGFGGAVAVTDETLDALARQDS